MPPDSEALEEFRRIFENLFKKCLGWDEYQIKKWVDALFARSGDSPMFYNSPPAYYAARAFIPDNLVAVLSPQEDHCLWEEIYQLLEGRGHWNDFVVDTDAAEIGLSIQALIMRHQKLKGLGPDGPPQDS